MKLKTIGIMLLVALLAAICIQNVFGAEEQGSPEEDDGEEALSTVPQEKLLLFGAGGYMGMNYLLDGYDQYDNNLNGGVFLSMGIADQNKNPKYTFRFTYECMPLIMPDGPYNMTDSITATTLDFLYSLDTRSNLSIYAGPGVGYYFDTVTMDTPASGYLEHVYCFMGMNISVGLTYYLFEKVVFLPEVRFHMIREPGSYWAKNIVYQLGLSYNFASASWGKWRNRW